MIITCQICGKTVEAKKSTKKYCSRSCENKAKYIREKERKTALQNGIDIDLKTCPICGTLFKPKDKSANQRICCYNCMPDSIQLTRGMFLAKIKEARGGKCIRCGYNTCIKALEFHHIDPSKKDFTISNDHFKLIEAMRESQKCILICSNCHKELHDNLWNIEDLEKKEEIGFDSQ